MNALSGRVPGVGRSGFVAALMAVGVIGNSVAAAPMKATRLQSVRIAAVEHWEGYYRQALATRSTNVEVPIFLRSLRLQSNGMLPESSFVTYLRWRRTLHPRRFDANHPNVARMLIQDELVRQTVRPIVPPVVPPVVPRTTNPRPQPLEPPRVPEPSSLALAAVLLGAGAWWRRRAQAA